MSALPSAVRRDAGRRTDTELVALHRAGEPDAFPEICDRYEGRLVRFAGRLLASRADTAEDVVQEALFRAHRSLLRDDAEIHLSGWLHKLVRNCCLDELGRKRLEAVPLHGLPSDPPALGADPAVLHQRRARTRETLGDLAALPDAQRHVLVRREIDGASHEEIARELQLTVPATRSLGFRARENLLKAADARDASCVDVRSDLLGAHDARRRASARTYRHLAACPSCRTFRAQLGTLRATLRILSPAPALLALVAVGGGKLVAGGGWGGKAAAAAAAATAVVAGGVTVLGPGDPTPVALRSPVLAAGALPAGAPLPARTALVTRTVRLPVAATVTLPCPDGMRVAGLVPVAGRAGFGYSRTTLVGSSRSAEIVFSRRAAGAVTVGTLCKTPDRRGSLLARTTASAAAATPPAPVGAARAHLRVRPSPSAAVLGTVVRSQPMTIRALRGRWVAVTTDAGERGWLPRAAIFTGK